MKMNGSKLLQLDLFLSGGMVLPVRRLFCGGEGTKKRADRVRENSLWWNKAPRAGRMGWALGRGRQESWKQRGAAKMSSQWPVSVPIQISWGPGQT